MKNSIAENYLDYLSLILVLSFIFIHNLFFIISVIIILLYYKSKEDGFKFMKSTKEKDKFKDKLQINIKEKNQKIKYANLKDRSDFNLIKAVKEFIFIQSLNDTEKKRTI